QTLLKANIPVVDLPGHAGTVRVIAGDYQSHQGPAKTFTPINLWEIQLPAGAIAELPASEGHTTMLMILRGGLSIDGSDDGQEGSLAIFDREGEGVRVTATTDSHLLLLSGQPLNEAIVGKGPFVMN